MDKGLARKEMRVSSAQKRASELWAELVEGSVFRFIPFNIFINELDINIRSVLQESRQALSIQKELEHHKELTLEVRIKKKKDKNKFKSAIRRLYSQGLRKEEWLGG